MEIGSRHHCLIYDGSPSRQLPALAAMILRKMDEGQRCLYLNSSPMVAGLRSCLAESGTDVASEISKGRLILSSESVAEGADGFNVDIMLQLLERALDQALNDGFKGLFATGDMTWEFGSKKDYSKLMEYEYRLEDLFRKRHELCGVCQYHRDSLPAEVSRHGLLAHQSIFINETLSRINPHYLPAGIPRDHLVLNPELDRAIATLCRL